MLIGYLLVFVIAALAGAWSLFIGVLVGLDPVGVYVAGVAGSLLWTSIALTAGGSARDLLVARLSSRSRERVERGRARRILVRFGEPGLAVVGGVLLGPTITLAAALVLDVDRRRFAIWYYGGTVVSFAVITAFWAAVL